jgi:SAM-dependent methyltransferase
MHVDEQKAEVRRFWEEKPCGSIHGRAPEGSREYFDQIEDRRRELEPFIDRYADFAGARDQDVLEVGVGLGTDFVRFARAGARVTGIDLTERSVELVQRRLELEGLSGDVRVADAEHLPFPDRMFDVVYSWGVLHHTPNPTRAIREFLRVVKPGGRVCVMVYARRSWVGFALWVRYALLRGSPRRSLASVLANHMESRGTRGFSKGEVCALFADLDQLTVDRVGTPYDRRVVGPVAGVTGPYLGWFLVVRGRRW